MEINNKLGNNAIRKVALLITKASELGMDVSGYGEASENNMSGYVYLWLEDYPFTLFIDLGSDDIQALWTNFDNGEEISISVNSMSLFALNEWAYNLDANSTLENN